MTRFSLTSGSGRNYSFPMADTKIPGAVDIELKRLEKRVDELLETVQQLKEENRALRQRQDMLAAEKLVVVCPREHRFAGKRLRSLRQLRHEHWLTFPERFENREASAANIFAQLLAHGVAEIDWTPVDSLTAQKRLIEAGFGIALLPESSIDEERRRKSLTTIAVADLDAANPIATIVRKDGYLSPASRQLLALLRAEFSNA